MGRPQADSSGAAAAGPQRALVRVGLLLAQLAACGTSSWSPVDTSGSTVAVAPANVVAGPTGRAEARVALRRADGSRLGWAGLRVAVTASACAVGPAAVVDQAGEARFAIGPCPPGAHLVRATLKDGGLLSPLATGSALNAFKPSAVNAEAIDAGAPINLAFDLGYTFVGRVRFTSSDPQALLPPPVDLDASAHGILWLGQQAQLRTPS